jgi:hypothetical protein
MCIKVIGIDPAPGKNSVVFDEEEGFKSLDAKKLQGYLNTINEPALICWDAPLSGPQQINSERADRKFNLYMRDIEYFLKEQNPPEGISVQGYAGCSHWTISQMLLGLPIIGPYHDNGNNPPFQLLTEDNKNLRLLQTPGKYVVEVHPAVALWLWLRGEVEDEMTRREWFKKEKNGKVTKKIDWMYKGEMIVQAKREKIKFFCEKLIGKIDNQEIIQKFIDTIPKTPGNKIDDYFDAMLAWLLGKLWVENAEKNKKGENQVILLGSQQTGAMLLPNSEDLQTQWNNFI